MLGGVNYDYSVKQSAADLPEQKVVSPADQRRALDVILSKLTADFLSLDDALVNTILPKHPESFRTRESIHGKTGVVLDPLTMAAASAQHSLSLMLVPQRLAGLEQQHQANADVPSVADIMQRIHDQVVDGDGDQDANGLLHQLVVDLVYRNYLNLLASKDTTQATRAAAYDALKFAQAFHQKRSSAKGQAGAFHLLQAKRLENVSLEQSGEMLDLPKMPPGSPI